MAGVTFCEHCGSKDLADAAEFSGGHAKFICNTCESYCQGRDGAHGSVVMLEPSMESTFSPLEMPTLAFAAILLGAFALGYYAGAADLLGL